MEDFTKLFGSLLAFVYHCFDRVVIRGHLPLLTRPENIVHFFREWRPAPPLLPAGEVGRSPQAAENDEMVWIAISRTFG
jgi:hypothetical protein